MITLEDYLMDRTDGLNPTLLANATETIKRWNMLLSYYYSDCPGAPRVTVTSGYRPPAINARTPGAALHSTHLTCEAMDGKDVDRGFAKWCLANLGNLVSIGLWMEDPRATPDWVHLQTRATHVRVFLPDADWAARLAGQPLTEDTL